MSDPRYSWLVHLYDNSTIQVDADEMRVGNDGSLVWLRRSGESFCVVHVRPCATFRWVSIMEQFAGTQAGFTLCEQPSGSSPAREQ